MDKRILKTRQAVYSGFAKALGSVTFTDMTIEDILKASWVSRSTFYAHFKSKEEVLSSISSHIFEHVFSHSLQEEETHDFSKTDIFDYSHLITHILYHLHDEKDLITTIISCECKHQFYQDLRDHIRPISERIVKSGMITWNGVPEALQITRLTESLILTVDYWFSNGCKETPEKITSFIYNR